MFSIKEYLSKKSCSGITKSNFKSFLQCCILFFKYFYLKNILATIKIVCSKIKPGSLAARGGSLITRGGRLVTRGGRLAARGGRLITRGGHLITRGGRLITRGGSLAARGGSLNTRCPYLILVRRLFKSGRLRLKLMGACLQNKGVPA